MIWQILPETVELLNHIWVALLAIAVALACKLMTNSIVLGRSPVSSSSPGGVIKFARARMPSPRACA